MHRQISKKLNNKVWMKKKQDFDKITLTGVASRLILPQETASSGEAPESEPSNSEAVLTKTA